jgi:Fur family peroxide stress response transcriptional regulator
MSTDDVASLLRRHNLRVTPQRRAILSAFKGGTAEHLAADEVLSRASLAVPEIGRGTVYATLAELTELGLLASVGNPEPVRYETNLEPHDHFRCRLCLRLFDVELGGDEVRTRGLTGFVIETVSVHAFGLCSQCLDYERGLTDGAARIMDRPTLSPDTLADLSCVRLASPVGELALAASSQGIVRVAFEDHADFDAIGARAKSRRGPAAGRRRLGVLDGTFGRYFGGDHAAAADLIDWRLSNDDGILAFQAVQKIPYGEGRSYELLMGALSPYDCGYLMGANPMPMLVPCHRVSRGSERPEIYVGGLKRLQFLHHLEAALP